MFSITRLIDGRSQTQPQSINRTRDFETLVLYFHMFFMAYKPENESPSRIQYVSEIMSRVQVQASEEQVEGVT